MSISLKRSRDTQPGASGDKLEKKEGGIIRFLLTLALIAWAVRSFVIASFYIPSGSMLPTLYIGDYIAVAKWPYGYSSVSFPWQFPSFEGRILSSLPKRGDVVVFRHPVEDADLIKRVIGLPGDTIEVRAGQVILNGKPLPRQRIAPFEMALSANSPCKVAGAAEPVFGRTASGEPSCRFPAYRESLPGGPTYTILDQVDSAAADHFSPVTVPEGNVFVMGDNRDDSADSRFQPIEQGVGFLPVENIVGRATITFWSTNGTASYWKPWTWFTALRGARIGNRYTGDPE